MQSIIEALYDCYPETRNYSTPERAKLSRECTRLWEQVEDVFGPDFVDRLEELYELRLGYQGLDHFSAGFRAGVRLMLEVFTPA